MGKKIFTVYLVFTLILLWIKATHALETEKLEKVRMSIPVTAMSQLPIYMGKHSGIFESDKMDLEIIMVKSNIVAPALLSGELDYTASADTMIRAATTGMPVRTLALIGVKMSLSLMVTPDIKSPKDLKGKSIAVSSKGSTTEHAAKDIVKYFGLDPEKDIITMGLGDQLNHLIAMKTGAISGAILTPPNDAKAEAMGFRRIAFAGDVLEEALQAGIATSLKKIQTNPAQVKRVVKAFLKSLLYTLEQKEEVIKFVSRQWNIERGIAEKSYNIVAKTFSRDGSASEKVIRKIMVMSAAKGISAMNIPLSQIVDFSFLNEAQAELKIK